MKMTVKLQTVGPPPIRPASHLSAASSGHRSSMMSSNASLEAASESKRRSILILSLLAVSAFLFVLCLCLLSALVLVGKSLSAHHSSPLLSAYLSRMSNGAGSTTTTGTTTVSVKKTGKSIDHFNRPALFDEDTGTSDKAEEEVNRTAIVLPNSVYSGTTMNNVLKIGSKVVEKLNFRLPRHVKPRHYELRLHPDLEQQTFSGQVGIDITVSEPTNYIVVHSNQLAINETAVKRLLPDRSEVPVVVKQAYAFDPHQYWVVETDPIEMGEYRLSMNFSGSLANRIVGFYSSSYRDKSTNTTRKIATSKFEPTFARQAFPCFDEPQLKATYTISLVHPNTNNYHAFIVSDFQHEMVEITPTIGDPFELRVYATPIQMNNVRFARDTAEKVIQHYINYFNISYPLPKLDMAAIPDFVSGAMETWGLVTYRETSILYNQETSSTANKQRVAEVIAHELAHMWFGNLVTMKWWNELWLNEGFASYIEYKGVDSAYPEWGIMEQFTIDNLHGVLTLDATIGSHPIVVKVETPNQITEIFDTITYSKGASVIRMLEDFVGETVFKAGVTAYLDKLKYGNGVSEDLMEELDELYSDPDDSTVTVSSVMDTFTKQKGFPVVTVEIVGSQFHLSQSRFLADPEANDTEVSEFGYKWYIPLTYITASQPAQTQRKWFPSSREKVYIDMDTPNSWIKLNLGQVGYYRVNYPTAMWEQFSNDLAVNVNAFNIGDRTGLLNDAFALADASLLRYDVALGLTKFLRSETEYVPWATVSSKLKSIRNLIYDYESYDDLMAYTRNLVVDAYEAVGWDVPEEQDNRDHMKNRLRATILDLACSFDYEPCLEVAYSKFQEWLQNGTVIHPDVRSVAYFYGVQKSRTEEWRMVKERYRTETDANEKSKLMSALTALPNARVLAAFLEDAWDPTLVREQDHLSCIQSVAANKAGEAVAWDHVRENWDRLVERFTLGERNLGRMIPSVTGRFSTKVRLQELEDFFRRNPDAGAGATARVQALENISNNIKWLDRNQQIIAEWLKVDAVPAR
ncbi:aminopeptidase A isoform X2 [Wyeomyia smithii]|uniref:aminopeptidase A isoform X2 n=1 Tax=Wyeomyia smithii TaxID=174621 RepID=UPI00246814EC|nr:aminopeptidase A isoform X2 [Wyeomyia smithii]